MSFKLIVKREAQIDLDEIFVWYEEQKIGLGFEFLEEFDKLTTKVLTNPYFASVILAMREPLHLKDFHTTL